MNQPRLDDNSSLQILLEPLLLQKVGVGKKIVGLKRQPSALRSSFAIEEWEVVLDDGRHLHLMFKDLCRNSLAETAARAKPDFLYNPLREIEIYRRYLTTKEWGTAHYYGSIVDTDLDRYWLFLEKVPGIELYRVGKFETWQAVARWLAAFHCHFLNDERLREGGSEVSLLNYQQDFFRLWFPRAVEFQRHTGIAAKDLERLEQISRQVEGVVARLVDWPLTLIHGEFYASNILLQQGEQDLRVCPIDWELGGTGPGLVDLAALTAGKWTEKEKHALALAYYETWEKETQRSSSSEEFLVALDFMRLFQAIKWLGWSRDWLPPPEHVQNWLAEALALADRIEL